jgi:hypothetical protein
MLMPCKNLHTIFIAWMYYLENDSPITRVEHQEVVLAHHALLPVME